MRGRLAQPIQIAKRQTWPLYGEMAKVRCMQCGILTLLECMREYLCIWCNEDFKQLAELFADKAQLGD
jgi:hypothetical protein